jgi:Holliday junction DNA helicase RuvA
VTNDVKTITKASGVGPKLAQRVILELKDKMKNEDLQLSEEDEAEVSMSDNKNEAISALVVLGYTANDAAAAVKKIDGTLSVEEIIKKALAGLL